MASWICIIVILLPIPLVPITITSVGNSLPFSWNSIVRSRTMSVLDYVCAFHVYGFTCESFAIVTSLVTLLISCRELLRNHGPSDTTTVILAERDCWVSALSLSSWIAVKEIRYLCKEIENLKRKSM